MSLYIKILKVLLSIGNLSSGRVGIVNMATANLHLAVVVAVRYSAVR